jgi:APA family basic amino acid/polyamine antiporter
MAGSGILTGGSIVFTYIGSIQISTAKEECKSPQRDLPIGNHRDAGHLYVAIYRCCSRAHGLVRWDTLVDDAAPVINTLKNFISRESGWSS